MMSFILGNMTGDPKMGNAINSFMNNGGNMNQMPQQQQQRSVPTRSQGLQTGRNTSGSMHNETEFLPPVDPDGHLEDPDAGTTQVGHIPHRTTRNNRDNLTKLVV
jgi:hypothetical protein